MKKIQTFDFVMTVLMVVALSVLSVITFISLHTILWTTADDTETYFASLEGGRQEFDCTSKGYDIHSVARTEFLSEEGSCLLVSTPFNVKRKVYVTTEIINLDGHEQNVQASIIHPEGTAIVDGSLKVNGIARAGHDSPIDSDDSDRDIIAVSTKRDERVILEYAFVVDPAAFSGYDAIWVRNDIAINSEPVFTAIGLRLCNTSVLLFYSVCGLVFASVCIGLYLRRFFKKRKMRS